MIGKAKAALAALLLAGLFTALTGLGLLYRADVAACDALYQTPAAADDTVVLVGIDPRALEEFGPYNGWTRDIVASVVETLNFSEDCRPAVIALDILYSGRTDPDLDEYLACAAGEYGNVVVAGLAQIGSELVSDGDGEYTIDSFSVLGTELPFYELRDAATVASINCMLDRDGVLRHHQLYVDLPDGTRMPSLALASADMYREHMGMEPVEQPPVNSRGFWYLPFCGRPGDFSSDISVADVLGGELPPEFFADRIVIVGPYAPALQDGYITAVDHARQMYGIEMHANAVQALLWGEYKREVGALPQLAALFLLLLVGFAGFYRRKVPLAALLWAVECGGWVLSCKLLYSSGLVLHVLWAPVWITVLFVGCIAYNYISAAVEHRRIRSTFGQYVDPAVVRELTSGGAAALNLGGRLLDIAVLFVDIRGFTTMSEVLTPEQVVEILNRYLTLTTKCVTDNHGMLDKFVGDCTMAVWNAPLPQEDYVMSACRAAMDMVGGSKPLAEELEREFGRTVSFGVGVNVGPAVVGNIGAPKRKDYTAIGDTVNTAARLEANAPAGTVYISRAVADALEGRIRVTSLGDSVKLKGKKDGFEVLRLEEILE